MFLQRPIPGQVYWLTFRIADDADSARRWRALEAALGALASSHWKEPTSFWMFRTAVSPAMIRQGVGSAINQQQDVVAFALLGSTEVEIVGKSNDQGTLRSLAPQGTLVTGGLMRALPTR
jgi:hypothetical protein